MVFLLLAVILSELHEKQKKLQKKLQTIIFVRYIPFLAAHHPSSVIFVLFLSTLPPTQVMC